METLSDLIEVVKGNIEDTREKIKELEEALEEEFLKVLFISLVIKLNVKMIFT